mgnify:FL=1
MEQLCPCGSTSAYAECCKLIHDNLQHAHSAEQLMRARYTAFSKGFIDFIYDSFHPDSRPHQHKDAIAQWASENKWLKLEILHSDSSHVEFKAHYLNADMQAEVHHEMSTFKKAKGIWYFLRGAEVRS